MLNSLEFCKGKRNLESKLLNNSSLLFMLSKNKKEIYYWKL